MEQQETERPKGRSMRELRAIIAAEDARRQRLLDAWGDLPVQDQVEVITHAESLREKYA